MNGVWQWHPSENAALTHCATYPGIRQRQGELIGLRREHIQLNHRTALKGEDLALLNSDTVRMTAIMSGIT